MVAETDHNGKKINPIGCLILQVNFGSLCKMLEEENAVRLRLAYCEST